MAPKFEYVSKYRIGFYNYKLLLGELWDESLYRKYEGPYPSYGNAMAGLGKFVEEVEELLDKAVRLDPEIEFATNEFEDWVIETTREDWEPLFYGEDSVTHRVFVITDESVCNHYCGEETYHTCSWHHAHAWIEEDSELVSEFEF